VHGGIKRYVVGFIEYKGVVEMGCWGEKRVKMDVNG
jgi:hypothetical protein